MPPDPDPAPPARDWNARYISGDTPWDSGHPSTELRRVVQQTDELPRGRLLELGCGAGTNAIYLARQGFDVTAVDGSQEAISRARRQTAAARGAGEQLSVEFHIADVLELPAALHGKSTASQTNQSPVEPLAKPPTARTVEATIEPFDVLFDRGCYHCVRQSALAPFQAMLERVSRPGTLFLLLTGNANEPRGDRGPPRVDEQELRDELGPWFEFLRISEFRFDDTGDATRPLAWSVLLQRR